MNYILTNPICTPYRQTMFDAGWDLKAATRSVIYPGENAIIPLGIKIEIPTGIFGLLTHRSSMAFKKGLTASLGIIDSSFKEEIKLCMFNHNEFSKVILEEGERVAQIIFMNYNPHYNLQQVKEFSYGGTKAGFGSTGTM